MASDNSKPETRDLYSELGQHHSALAAALHAKGLSSLHLLLSELSKRYGLADDSVHAQLQELLDWGAYDEAGHPRVFAKLLEVVAGKNVFTPQAPLAPHPFSKLIQEYSVFGRDRLRSSSAVDFSYSLKGLLKVRSPGWLPHLSAYIQLYKGEAPPLHSGAISIRALQLVELLRIPSSRMMEMLPELEGKFLYTDGVRQSLPGLARLIRKHRLYTIAAFERNFGPQVTPEVKQGLHQLSRLEFSGTNPAAEFLESIFPNIKEHLVPVPVTAAEAAPMVEDVPEAAKELKETRGRQKLVSNRRRRRDREEAQTDAPDSMVEVAELVGPKLATENLARIANHLRYYLNKAQHPLEPDQVEIMESLITDLKSGNHSGYFIEPPGIGKTVVLGAFLDALQDLNEEFIEDGLDGILILVDKVSTAEQTYETLINYQRRDGSNRPLYGWGTDQVAVYYGTGPNATPTKRGEALGSPNVIMTVASYRELEKAGEALRQRRWTSVIDEVDQAKGFVTTPMIRALAKESYVLGASATDWHVGPEGVTRIGPLLFDRAGPFHETSWATAAERGQISPIKNILCVTNLESGIERSIRGRQYREYTDEEVNAIVTQTGRDDAAIRAIATFVDDDTGIAFKDLDQIWYCFGIRHANRIADKLNAVFQKKKSGVPLYPHGYAVAVSSETPKNDWTDEHGKRQLGLNSILEFHRQGVIPVLTNADLLIRSFDSKHTSLAVMLRPFGTPTPVAQAGGRISRLDHPNKLGYVVNFHDRDMVNALTFTDITGSSQLGMRPGAVYSAEKTKRAPDLNKLDPSGAVEIIFHVEPQDIQKYIARRERNKQRARGPNDMLEFQATLLAKGITGKHTLRHLFAERESLGVPVSEAVQGTIAALMDKKTKSTKLDQHLWDDAEDVIYPLPDIAETEWRVVDQAPIHAALDGRSYGLYQLREAVKGRRAEKPAAFSTEPRDLSPIIRDLDARLPVIISGQIERILPEEQEALQKALLIMADLPFALEREANQEIQNQLFAKGVVGPHTLAQKAEQQGLHFADDESRAIAHAFEDAAAISVTPVLWRAMRGKIGALADVPPEEFHSVTEITNRLRKVFPNNHARETQMRAIIERDAPPGAVKQDLLIRLPSIISGHIDVGLAAEHAVLTKALDVAGETTVNITEATAKDHRSTLLYRGIIGPNTLRERAKEVAISFSDTELEALKSVLEHIYGKVAVPRGLLHKLTSLTETVSRTPFGGLANMVDIRKIAATKNVFDKDMCELIKADPAYKEDPVALDILARSRTLGDDLFGRDNEGLAREKEIFEAILAPLPLHHEIKEAGLSEFRALVTRKGFIGPVMVRQGLAQPRKGEKALEPGPWLERLFEEYGHYTRVPTKELEAAEKLLKAIPDVSEDVLFKLSNKDVEKEVLGKLEKGYEAKVVDDETLAGQIADYEKLHNLPSYHITAHRLGSIRAGRIGTVLKAEMGRIHLVLALPAENIKLSSKEMDELEELCTRKGLVGRNMIKHALTGLAKPVPTQDVDIIYKKSIVPLPIWKRINTAIESLPNAQPGDWLRVTEPMRQKLRISLEHARARPNTLADRLEKERKEKGLVPLDLDGERLSAISHGKIKTILAVEWNAVELFFEDDFRRGQERHQLVKGIKVAAEEKGIVGFHALSGVVEKYQGIHGTGGEKAVGLGAARNLWRGDQQWETTLTVLDTISAAIAAAPPSTANWKIVTPLDAVALQDAMTMFSAIAASATTLLAQRIYEMGKDGTFAAIAGMEGDPEAAKIIASDLDEGRIQSILDGEVKRILQEEWNVLWATTSKPLRDDGVIMRSIEKEDREAVSKALAEKGIPAGPDQFKLLLRFIAKHEIDNDNFQFQSITGRLEKALLGGVPTVAAAVWDKMWDVLNKLQPVEGGFGAAAGEHGKVQQKPAPHTPGDVSRKPPGEGAEPT